MGRYALLIGTSRYQDARLSELTMPQADVAVLSSLLGEPSIGAFDQVTPLLDQPDHVARRAISRFFQNRGRDDLLLLYFSGHGVKDRRGQLYLTFYNTEHDDLAGTAIRDTFIAERMDASRSQAQLLILDCCYSGAFGKGAKAALGTSAGVGEAFLVEQGVGRYVLTATDALQFAWEGDQILGAAEHSLFTHFLIQGLQSGEADIDQDGRVTVEEIHEYVYGQIQAETPVQRPQLFSRPSAPLGDLVLALNPAPLYAGPRLPEDLEIALRSEMRNVRWGAVAELIGIARGDDPDLATLAHEHLADMAQNDPDERVRGAAQSFYDEEEALRLADEQRIQREEALARLEEARRLQAEAERIQREAEDERARLEAAEQARQEQLEQARRAREITMPPRPPAEVADHRAEPPAEATVPAERPAAPTIPEPAPSLLSSQDEASLKAQAALQETASPESLATTQPAARRINPGLAFVGIAIVGLLVGLLALAKVFGGSVAPQERASEEPVTEAPRVDLTTEEPAPTEGGTVDEVPAGRVEGRIGIVLPTRDEPRWIQDETRFTDAFAEAGVDVEILFSEGDSSKELANVRDLIMQGVEVLIITPHDATAAAAAAEAAHEAGVKVISYDRLIRETDAVDYYVTFDSIDVGEAQGQYLVDHASGTGNPLYLYAGAASDNNAFLFFEGAWNVLQPKIADGTFYVVNSDEAVALQDKAELTRDEMDGIIGQITTAWDYDTTRSLAEANLTAASVDDKGDVFILGPNDGTARAIADVFAADADVSSYMITGQDAGIASIQYIIDGKQSMTVLKDVRTLVSDAIAAAIDFLNDETPPETTTYNNGVIDVPASPSEVVTVDQSNVVAAIIDSGYWPADEFTGLETSQ